MLKIDMLCQYVKTKIPSLVTFQGKNHISFVQYSLEEAAQSFAWLMEIVDIPITCPKEAWKCLAGWCSVEQTMT